MPSTQHDDALNKRPLRRIRWRELTPFFALHLAALAVFWVGVSPLAVMVAIGLYVLRMFAITGFYHRYFAHKTFQAGRIVQFVFAYIGAMATQKGPLWWASHHRHHHRHTDTDQDPHTPNKGFWYSHMGWFLTHEHVDIKHELIKDWSRFPELKWLDKYHLIAPISLAACLLGCGAYLQLRHPDLGVTAAQLFVWGFLISTIALTHITLCVNSIAHLLGSRTYNTPDTSRNNFILAILTLGEGWHNNHHFYQGSARQGFRWWQIDITYYLLWLMSKINLVSQLKPIPNKAYTDRTTKREHS